MESLASGGAHGEVEAQRLKPHVVAHQPCACLMEHHANRTYPGQSLPNLKNSGRPEPLTGAELPPDPSKKGAPERSSVFGTTMLHTRPVHSIVHNNDAHIRNDDKIVDETPVGRASSRSGMFPVVEQTGWTS
jgi:hypothetical protein